MIRTEEIKEKLLLVGVSAQDGDDTEDSLEELAELVETAGEPLSRNGNASIRRRISEKEKRKS